MTNKIESNLKNEIESIRKQILYTTMILCLLIMGLSCAALKGFSLIAEEFAKTEAHKITLVAGIASAVDAKVSEMKKEIEIIKEKIGATNGETKNEISLSEITRKLNETEQDMQQLSDAIENMEKRLNEKPETFLGNRAQKQP